MLRERTRSHLKDQQMDHSLLTLTMSDSGSDSMGFNHKTNSFFNAPGLFVGLSPKGISDCDSVRSPTSPLDFRLFSNLGNSYRSQRSTLYGQGKSWDSSKVGLSILNSLDADVKLNNIQSWESKNILLGQKVRIKAPNANSFDSPKSLPRNLAIFPQSHFKSPSDVIFEIGEAPFQPEYFGKIRSCSLDSCKSFSTLARLGDANSKLSSGSFPLNNITTTHQPTGELDLNCTPMSTGSGSPSEFIDGLSASEIELSEDYTCVISHGPNPKKTHIYGDCILGCSSCEEKETGIPQANTSSTAAAPFPSNNFLKLCYYCNKKLDGEVRKHFAV
ncbi:FCS-Like Zinc finger 11-like isoform X2 [Euphorbia lathyris]|uniref:FCS-Like Zinc finger 11-like isoform X2 n=1 Tax=Euphorbia lathyris TaxID=212925 RepID=UPI003313988B